MSRRLLAAMLATLASWVLVASVAAARPGGGQSFSRSSSSSSSSGGFRSGSSSSSSSSSSSGGTRSWSSTSSSSGSTWSSTSSSAGGSHTTWSTPTSSSGGTTGYTYPSTPYTTSGGTTGYTYPSTPYATSGGTGYTYPSTPYPSSDGAPRLAQPEAPPDRSLSRAFVVVVLVLVVFVAAMVLYGRYRQRQLLHAWEARMAEEDADRARAERYDSITAALRAIRANDDAFSYVLFEDFLYALYAEVHGARGGQGLDRLAPYLSSGARATLARMPAKEVDAIVVGGMRVESITTEGNEVCLDVVFTSNLTERAADDRSQAYYMEERWHLRRGASAKSRPPERARTIGCPSCGAPLDKRIGRKCGYCGVVSKPAEHDWFVVAIDVLSREERGPMLTGTTEEEGTDWPTVVAPDAKRELDRLRARDPAFRWTGFVSRVEHVFERFHASWAAQDLAGVRPYLSDNLYEIERYWVDAYKGQALRNVTEDARMVTVHLARVRRDRFFEAITVRVFATCLDYTLDGRGAVVGGDRDHVRAYSEYWTFIRRAGTTGAARSDGACPSCGAPLDDVNMAGNCGHCGVKVTSGEFDWVLSRIEQDEVYEAAA